MHRVGPALMLRRETLREWLDHETSAGPTFLYTTMKRFLPAHDLILLLPDDDGRVGRIILPANRSQLPTTIGTVVAVGPGPIAMDGKRTPMDLPVGCRIMVANGEAAHPAVMLDGVKHILVQFSAVMGSIEDD